jgi:hypothetical protein
MSLFVLHFMGDIDRDELNTRSTRSGAYVREYFTLETIPEPDRRQFAWMLEHGERVTNCGSYVYQIRPDRIQQGQMALEGI